MTKGIDDFGSQNSGVEMDWLAGSPMPAAGSHILNLLIFVILLCRNEAMGMIGYLLDGHSP
jgi:hypothetical protein